MFNLLLSNIGQQRVYQASDLFSILDNRSDIANINSGIELKYKSDKSLIDLLNKATKIL